MKINTIMLSVHAWYECLYFILFTYMVAKAKREEESASRIDRTAKNLQRMMDTFCFHVRRVEGTLHIHYYYYP